MVHGYSLIRLYQTDDGVLIHEHAVQYESKEILQIVRFNLHCN